MRAKNDLKFSILLSFLPVNWGWNPTPRTYGRIHRSFVEFAFHLKREGYKPSTIESNVKALKALAKSCNLNDPKSFKRALALRDVSESRKWVLVHAYRRYAKWRGIDFNPPRYRRVEKLPFVPLESEIGQLIARALLD